MRLYSINELNDHKHGKDSHKGETAGSILCSNYRETSIVAGRDSGAFSHLVYYPRIKKCIDGSYIMFMHDRRVSSSTYYAKSADGIHYSPRKPFMTVTDVVRDDGEEDKLAYCNIDGLVLPSGEILAFVSYRYNKGYVLDAKYGGILMRRSLDNGETWSEPREIYRGRNWESFPLLLPSGEIQLYFSHTAPKFYLDKTVRTDSKIHTSSGSAIIRSFDNGNTWVPDVKEAPYAAHRVTQNYIETMANGTKIFTNQMPVAAYLNCGDILLATESDTGEGFYITLSYSHDLFKTALDIDEDGPEDKLKNIAAGAAPYVVQMPSGETALVYNSKNEFLVMTGDEKGRGFDPEKKQVVFSGHSAYWGNIMVDTDHSLLLSVANVNETKENGKTVAVENGMMVSRYYLNHRIDPVSLAAAGDEWENNKDAFFLGAESETNMSLRFSYNDDVFVVRADILTDNLSNGVGARLRLYGEKTLDVAMFADESCVAPEGSLTVVDKFENGAVIELYIPREAFPDNEFAVFAELAYNRDGEIKWESFPVANKETGENCPKVVFC